MKSVFMLILLMLGIGFLARNYSGRVRALLLLGIGAVVVYVTVKL